MEKVKQRLAEIANYVDKVTIESTEVNVLLWYESHFIRSHIIPGENVPTCKQRLIGL